MTKVGFVSLGCPKNLVDSEVMMGILAREGYELTPRADEAEVLVVNTCSFIEAGAEGIGGRDSGDGRAQEIWRGEKIDRGRMPGGALSRRRFWSRFRKWTPSSAPAKSSAFSKRSKATCACCPRQPPAFLYHDLTPRVITTPRHAAYIKIAEGCDHPCTFCIIPQLARKISQPAI